MLMVVVVLLLLHPGHVLNGFERRAREHVRAAVLRLLRELLLLKLLLLLLLLMLKLDV